jgi:uncharacterized membrane protein YecN with MAPEG domain
MESFKRSQSSVTRSRLRLEQLALGKAGIDELGSKTRIWGQAMREPAKQRPRRAGTSATWPGTVFAVLGSNLEIKSLDFLGGQY